MIQESGALEDEPARVRELWSGARIEERQMLRVPFRDGEVGRCAGLESKLYQGEGAKQSSHKTIHGCQMGSKPRAEDRSGNWQ